jgi:dienelactone hydrolase
LFRTTWLTAALLATFVPAIATAQLPFELRETYPAEDTLAVGDEPSVDARACLEGLTWSPRAFEVSCEPPRQNHGDVLVRFPSPVDSGDAANDLVAMEWYIAQEEQRPVKARAIVVVHESGRDMAVGRLIARGMRLHGLHAFLVQLPHYGARRGDETKDDPRGLVDAIQQGVADVRRARDAVAALPPVDTRHIALQGTSLGGFVATLAGSLDDGYDSVFLMLAGGNLYEVLQSGEKDTADARQRLAEAGLTGEKLKAFVHSVEPTRVAHRLRPQRTWLFSGNYDKVVPIKNALILKEAAGLDDTHHIRMLADHYSGIIYLPSILGRMRYEITSDRHAK